MFNFIFIGFFLILGSVGVAIPNTDLNVAGFLMFGIATAWSLASVINSLTERNRHIKEFQELHGEITNYMNYKKVKAELSAMLEKFLGDAYPKYEEKLVSAVTTSNTNSILIQYPELAASATFIKLTTDLSSAIHTLYQKKNNIVDSYSRMKGRLLSEWVWFKPTLPADLSSKMSNEDF